jgi:hypothetical protein
VLDFLRHGTDLHVATALPPTSSWTARRTRLSGSADNRPESLRECSNTACAVGIFSRQLPGATTMPALDVNADPNLPQR